MMSKEKRIDRRFGMINEETALVRDFLADLEQEKNDNGEVVLNLSDIGFIQVCLLSIDNQVENLKRLIK